MQMTPLGTTNPQPVYRFITRKKDPVLDISASSLVLTTKKYKSFEDFLSHIQFLLDRAISHVDTPFFTRVGLRYINNISGIQQNGADILEWINSDLIMPVAGRKIGAISNMKNELAGQFKEGDYTFRYGLSPASKKARNFVLDWDYYSEDVEVKECINLLNTFHVLHFPFFWWTLGEKAKNALACPRIA